MNSFFLVIKSKLINLLVIISLIIVSLNLTIRLCHAQELTIAVPLVEQPMNIVESNHPFAQLVLFAATQPLLRAEHGKNGKIQLVLVDSYGSNIKQNSIELRLRSGASFINAQLVEEEDLKASLSRCLVRPTEKYLSKYNILPTYNVFSKNQRIFISLENALGQESILNFLENCPIFEARSLRLFGEDLGIANLILGTGPYQLVSRTKNREAKLERMAKAGAWAEVITIRGIANADHALTALQTGTVDAFYTQESSVCEKALNDPTLRILSCGVYNIILRKGLEIGCYPASDPGSVRYSSL